MNCAVWRLSFGFVVATVVGIHLPGVPAHANPIGPEPHNGVTVWTGYDSTPLSASQIREIVGPFGAATLATGDGIVFTAREAGVGGHDITIRLVNPGAPNSPMSVTVTDSAIVVSLATNASGVLTSTAAQVAAAVNASPAASALVGASTGVPGTNIVGALGQTPLTPVIIGNVGLAVLYQSGFGAATLATSEGIVFTARETGVGGHDITISFVDPNASNSPLIVTVTDSAIVVSLATNASGALTSTTAQVAAAVNASVAASALVSASPGVPGTDIVGGLAQTALTPTVVEAGPYAGVYDTLFSNSASHPQDALIAFLGGLSITADSLYLYVRDADQAPAFYVYDLLAGPDAWNGLDDLILNGFWAPTGSIASVTILGTPAAVPEVSSIALLALGLGTRAWSRRNRRRTRA